MIITDLNKFFDRLFEKIEWRVQYASLVNLVEYYEEDKTKNLNPMFNKTVCYSWQNELRIAVGRLDIHHKLKNGNYPIKKLITPLKLKIGNLNDITRFVSIEDFISGNWDKTGIKFSLESPFLKGAIAKTNEIMSDYSTKKYKPIFTIG